LVIGCKVKNAYVYHDIFVKRNGIKIVEVLNMLAKNIIDEIIQPLKPADNCLQVLSWMEEYKVMHLPVVENGMYKGLLAEADIYALPEPDISVSGISETLTRDAVKAEDHFFNVLPHFSEHQHSVVPVVAKNDEYVGSITQASLLKAYARLEGVGEPGAVVVIEINQADYVLSQIAQIAENNDIRLVSVHTMQHTNSVVMDLILKTNTEEVDSFLKTLERYDFHVKMAMTRKDPEMEKLDEHYQYIMTYLGI